MQTTKQQHHAGSDNDFPRLAQEGEKPVLVQRVEDQADEGRSSRSSSRTSSPCAQRRRPFTRPFGRWICFLRLKQLCKIRPCRTSANAVGAGCRRRLITMLSPEVPADEIIIYPSCRTLAALFQQQVVSIADLSSRSMIRSVPPALARVPHDDAQQFSNHVVEEQLEQQTNRFQSVTLISRDI